MKALSKQLKEDFLAHFGVSVTHELMLHLVAVLCADETRTGTNYRSNLCFPALSPVFTR